ncbi:hypothetical protein EcWSU1_03799 [Enterobacter ludwigii]|uniref:Uncharacterized protein n=1 Tax=Enterobacter ludwigii TaxID=299767 RepID=G8LE32_9ENTR|nr:hypothetical protein EcWSU1_03799 [Enterobacter ludwigii]
MGHHVAILQLDYGLVCHFSSFRCSSSEGTPDDVMCIKSGRNVKKRKAGCQKRLACRFVDTTAHFQRNVAVLAQLGHTVFFKFRQQGRDGAAIQTIAGQTRWHAQTFKEAAGCFDSRVDTRIVRTFGDVPHALSVLQQFGAFGITFFVPQCRQDDGQRLRVIQTVHGRQFVAQHMGCPVLRHAGTDQTVQRLGCRPHHVGAHIVVFRLFQRFRAVFNQRQQNAFREAILNFGIYRVGNVLLNGVHKRIDHTVRDLTCRQGVGVNRIEDGEYRLNVIVHKGLLITRGFTGDNGTFVGFRTGRGQGQHGTHWDRAFDIAAAGFQNVPRVNTVRVVRRSGDEFGAIQDGAAADCQQEGDFFITGDLDRVHQCFIRRVRLDTAELTHVQTFQRAVNLIQYAGFFHAAATVGDQYAGVSGDLCAQVGDSAFTKQNAGWGVEIKIIHCSFPYVGEKPWWR